MRIDRFDLIAFGPFTNKRLDLSVLENGLHIVYGRNEAGKSTSLRALTAFLYGFDHRVQDGWLHGPAKLVVGGALTLGNGRRLNLTRYKRRKNDLIDDDTGQPVEQGLLDNYLVGKSDFQNAFGISHEALRRGVETVLTAGGELGQTLFTATSGLTLLKTVLAGLDEKQKALFAPRAQKAAINSLVSRLSELHKQIRQVSAKPGEWQHKKRELEELETAKQDVDRRVLELNRIISADSRVRGAIQFLPRLDETERELERLAAVPILSEDFKQRRIRAQVGIEESREAQDLLQEELARIDQRLQRLGFDETLVANRERIEALATEIRSYRDWVTDSKNLRTRIHDANRQAQAALEHLQKDLKLEDIDALRLSRPAENALRRLAKTHALLEQKKTTARNELADVQPLIAKARDQLATMGRPHPVRELKDVLGRLSDHGKPDITLSEMQSDLSTLRDQLEKDLAGLGLWSGDLEAFEALPLPPEETLRRFERELVQCRQDLTATGKEMRRLDRDLQAKRGEYAQTVADKRLPTPRDLERQRELRDQGWRSVRVVWLEGGEPEPLFLAAFPGQPTLAEAYERSVKEADDTADRLRTEAAAVAIAQRLREDIADLEKLVETQRRRQHDQERREREQQSHWRDLWRACDIDPYPPAEMLQWARKAESIRNTAADFRRKRGRQDQLQLLLEALDAELSAALSRLGVQVMDGIGHGALVDLARDTVKHNEALGQQRQALEVRLEELIGRREGARQQRDRAAQEMAGWGVQWQAALQPLKLPASTTPDIALEYLDELKDILATYDEAQKHQSRIEAMERNRRDFQKRVQEAVTELAPQLAPYDPDRAAEGLKSLLGEHLEQRQQYRHLEKDRHEKREKLTKEQEKAAGCRETLRQLCVEATAGDPGLLPEIERQSGLKTPLLTRAAAIRDRLSELAAGQPLQAFIDQVRQQDPDALAATLEKNELEKDELQARRETLVAGIALARADLDKFDGRSEAADLALEANGLAGRLEAEVAQYVKLHLASQMLTRAIERYRKENESPILEAAGGYFEVMTRGAFKGLKADFDDKGNPVIKALRAADKAALAIEEMSDGSRDQLFLSLRLGGLSRHLEANGGMPFIVDDVLVNFDDDRAAAALEALSTLAARTQILFFTHHRHLVEMARATIPERLRCLHSL